MPVWENIYNNAPVWLQELGISAYGLFWKWLRLGGSFDREVAAWKAREQWDIDRLGSYTEKNLKEMISLAFYRTEYYPRLWREHGLSEREIMEITPDTLNRLPVSSRRDFNHQPWLVYNGGRGGQRFSFSRSTSGSTGTPLTVSYSPEVYRRAYAAVEARGYNWAGVSVRDPRTTIGARSIIPPQQKRPPYWRHNFVEKHMYMSAFHISPRNAGSYCDTLNAFAPKLMTGFSSSHYFLALMIESLGLTVHSPVVVIPGSDECSPAMREKIGSVLGAPVYPLYGMVEQCLLATTCEHGSLHVHPDFGIVEVLGNNGESLPPGVRGRIVATGLTNSSTLFVRYDTGDTGSWSPQACPCGRDNLPVLDGLVGRVEDVIRTPEGREFTRLDRLFTGLDGIDCSQVIQQHTDSILVRLIYSGRDKENLENEIRRRARGQLGPMSIEFDFADEIPRDPNGKFHAVVSRIGKRGRSQQSSD